MAPQSGQHSASQGKCRLSTIDGVVVYARKDEQGRFSVLDAIDQDPQKIRAIADRLWRRGFGVMRQRNPRAGKVFYLFKATWAGPGEPPDDPLEEI